MTKKKTRKLPQYLHFIDGRYCIRVPIKPELRPYLAGKHQFYHALGGDLRTAKENSHYHVAVFKDELRKAAEAYQRDTGKRLAVVSEPIEPEKLVARHYREIVAYDDFARTADRRYSTVFMDDVRVKQLREGMAGRLTDEQYAALLEETLEQAFKTTAQVPDDFDFRALAIKLCAAQYEGLSRIAERDEGDFTGKPKHPAVVEALAREDAENLVEREIREFDSWTFDHVIAEQERKSARLTRAKSAATLEKYRSAQYDFEHFRKIKKVALVTLADGKAWRDHMIDEGKLARKTIKDKITIIRTLLGWANIQSENQMFPNGDPWKALELPVVEKTDSAERTYSLVDARHFLEFSRSASRASFRWIPWIIAHTGARVNEITPLEKRDIIKVEGNWFIHIRVGNGRTTKTHKARKIPVHRALLREGFIDWVQTLPEGRLFPGGKNEDQRLREWIHEKVFPDRTDLPPPNHGFRHLFEDAMAGVTKTASLYIAGRSSGTSADDYGGSDFKLTEIANEMKKVRDILEPAKEN